jgi:hypothetical protein
MEQILLINPRKRKPKMARKARSAAQKAATRRMLAANKSRRSNPRKRRAAPRRAIARRPAVHHARRRRNPIHLFSAPRRHRRRRNPISTSGIKGLLMPAVFGAAGAVLVDAAMNYLPLPDTFKTGTIGMVTKAGAALLLGTMGRKVFGARATEMAVGSLTVQTYALLRQFLPASITGLGYVSAGLVTSAGNVPIGSPAASAGVAGMGMYVGGSSRLGEYVN